MKKILFFAAVTALAFTACTSDELTEQNAQQPTTEDVGVGFDVYVPGATQQTRSGHVGVLNTTYLQQTGFGIFAYQQNNTSGGDAKYATGLYKPDFMWNQQVFYNSSAAGWYYAPLKYWPNETKNDSQVIPSDPAGMPDQTTPKNIDRVSFFAYAPWVRANSNGRTTITDAETETKDITHTPANNEQKAGISYLINNEGKLCKWPKDASSDYFDLTDPKLWYYVARDPNYSVDLLWGVAPAGGLSYTDVSGENVTVDEGKPLLNLTKPAVNTNLKFMFQHALARLGVKVVAAVDQVAAGGDFDYGNSKITIEEIAIKGNFGEQGILNLKNKDTNIALWSDVTKCESASNALKLNAATNSLAEHLRYDATLATAKKQQTHTGVTTDLADAIQVSSIKDEFYNNYSNMFEAGKLTYSPTTPYFGGPTKNADKEYVAFHNGSFPGTSGIKYFYYFTTDNAATNNKSYTEVTLNAASITYPNALVWKNICSINENYIHQIGNATAKNTYRANIAYRKVGNTYTPTGQVPEIGDYVFCNGTTDINPSAAPTPAPTQDAVRYTAVPNYFMIIPTQALGDGDTDEADRTLKVKITYYVSTTDASLKDGIVYTKNEVEKDVVLPHLKNGVAYNLKLILGLTSVKVEAEVADWVTTEGVVNLPQNTSE